MAALSASPVAASHSRKKGQKIAVFLARKAATKPKITTVSGMATSIMLPDGVERNFPDNLYPTKSASMETRKKAATTGKLKAEELKSEAHDALDEKKSNTKASTKPFIGSTQSRSFILDLESMGKIPR